MGKIPNASSHTPPKLRDVLINNVKKIAWILGKDAFLFIIIFVLLEVIFGEFLFYKYVFLVKLEKSETITTSTKFQENVYQSVLKEWQARENTFKNSPQESYSDPFQ